MGVLFSTQRPTSNPSEWTNEWRWWTDGVCWWVSECIPRLLAYSKWGFILNCKHPTIAFKCSLAGWWCDLNEVLLLHSLAHAPKSLTLSCYLEPYWFISKSTNALRELRGDSGCEGIIIWYLIVCVLNGFAIKKQFYNIRHPAIREYRI